MSLDTPNNRAKHFASNGVDREVAKNAAVGKLMRVDPRRYPGPVRLRRTALNLARPLLAVDPLGESVSEPGHFRVKTDADADLVGIARLN